MDFFLRRYALPLRYPIRLKNQYGQQEKLSIREGLYLELKDGDGRAAIAEIAPLPLFSKESLEDSSDQIRFAIPKLQQLAFSGLPELISFFDQVALFPSVRCGIEALYLSYLKQKLNKKNVSALFEKDMDWKGFFRQEGDVFSTQLITIGDDLSRIKNTSCIKIKLGRASLEEEVLFLSKVIGALDEKQCLRLDSNRAWSLEEAIFFFQSVQAKTSILDLTQYIEYMEEPLQDPSQLSTLFDATKIPIALDESLLEDYHPDLLNHLGICTLILKPMLLGGFLAIHQNYLSKGSTQCVVSCLFESSVGLDYLREWASILFPNAYHGLVRID